MMRHSHALILALLLAPAMALAGQATSASDAQQEEHQSGAGNTEPGAPARETNGSGAAAAGETADQREATGEDASPESSAAREGGASEGARPAFLPSRRTSDVMSNELVGSSVVNAEGEKIGDIRSILIDRSGRATAVVVGVGGFLGLGERSVAIAWEALEITEDGEEDTPQIRTALSRDELEQAPEFDAASTAAQAPANSSGGGV